MSRKCAPSKVANSAAVTSAPVAARRRGSTATRYAATSRNTASCASPAQDGETKKSPCRMLDTVWASVTTEGMLDETGVTCSVPTPAAEAPMSTILSLYLAAGILPLSTS